MSEDIARVSTNLDEIRAKIERQKDPIQRLFLSIQIQTVDLALGVTQFGWWDSLPVEVDLKTVKGVIVDRLYMVCTQKDIGGPNGDFLPTRGSMILVNLEYMNGQDLNYQLGVKGVGALPAEIASFKFSDTLQIDARVPLTNLGLRGVQKIKVEGGGAQLFEATPDATNSLNFVLMAELLSIPFA